MKKLAGFILIVALAAAILAGGLIAANYGVSRIFIRFVLPLLALPIYWITRWMRGPGSEFGTPVPSLSLSERALDDARDNR